MGRWSTVQPLVVGIILAGVRLAACAGVGMPWEAGAQSVSTSMIGNYLPYGLVVGIVGGVIMWIKSPEHESLMHRAFMWGIAAAIGAGAITYIGFFGATPGATPGMLP